MAYFYMCGKKIGAPAAPARAANIHSHSMVPGGFDVMS